MLEKQYFLDLQQFESLVPNMLLAGKGASF